MKLNNKGITIISIVLIFLSILLIDVKDINDNSKENSTYLLNKALITKIIEEDLMEYKRIKISSCGVEIKSIYSGYNVDGLDDKLKANECVKLTLCVDDSCSTVEPTYLVVLYLKSRGNYNLSYIHGTKARATYAFKEFEKYNVTETGSIKNKMNIIYSDGEIRNYDSLENYSSTNAVPITINVPMVGNDGKDYTISIPYFGKVDIIG